MATAETTRTAAEKQVKERDNPAHAVLRHLAARHVEIVQAAFREVTLERLESNGAVAGIAALRAELFSGGGAASGVTTAHGGGAVSAGTSGRSNGGGAQGTEQPAKPGRKPRQMSLGEAANSDSDDSDDESSEDEDVDEEEVEDDEETPAPDEAEERTPLRRPVARNGKGKGDRKGKR